MTGEQALGVVAAEKRWSHIENVAIDQTGLVKSLRYRGSTLDHQLQHPTATQVIEDRA